MVVFRQWGYVSANVKKKKHADQASWGEFFYFYLEMKVEK